MVALADLTDARGPNTFSRNGHYLRRGCGLLWQFNLFWPSRLNRLAIPMTHCFIAPEDRRAGEGELGLDRCSNLLVDVFDQILVGYPSEPA